MKNKRQQIAVPVSLYQHKEKKAKKAFRIYSVAVLSVLLCTLLAATAFAAGDPLTVVSNLSTFIFAIIRAIA